MTAVLQGEEEPRCVWCGRSEGLAEPHELGGYQVTKCDCNYQHIRDHDEDGPWAPTSR